MHMRIQCFCLFYSTVYSAAFWLNKEAPTRINMFTLVCSRGVF